MALRRPSGAERVADSQVVSDLDRPVAGRDVDRRLHAEVWAERDRSHRSATLAFSQAIVSAVALASFAIHRAGQTGGPDPDGADPDHEEGGRHEDADRRQPIATAEPTDGHSEDDRQDDDADDADDDHLRGEPLEARQRDDGHGKGGQRREQGDRHPVPLAQPEQTVVPADRPGQDDQGELRDVMARRLTHADHEEDEGDPADRGGQHVDAGLGHPAPVADELGDQDQRAEPVSERQADGAERVDDHVGDLVRVEQGGAEQLGRPAEEDRQEDEPDQGGAPAERPSGSASRAGIRRTATRRSSRVASDPPRRSARRPARPRS